MPTARAAVPRLSPACSPRLEQKFPRPGSFLSRMPKRGSCATALSRPDVDPERLAVAGVSWGGHNAFKGAQHDPRIKAMIASPATPNVFRAALAQPKGHSRKDPITLQIARECFEQLAHPLKQLVIFTRKQGSEAHRQVDNLALPNGVLFDWLD